MRGIIVTIERISTHLWSDEHRQNVSRQGILCTPHGIRGERQLKGCCQIDRTLQKIHSHPSNFHSFLPCEAQVSSRID